jgi:crotonobetainyl-CoA:carnitine CoA-transferase CaiB-like acyl-CoA transferase
VSVRFLKGLRVLELGDAVAGAAATGLLAGLGADVTAVIELNSPHRRGRPTAGSGSLLGACLDRGKELVVGGHDLIVDLLSQPFDVVLVDRIAGTSEALNPLRAFENYLSFVDAHNLMAWVTVSAFGLSGPRRDDIATELGVAAASGMLASVRDEASGQPLKLGGQQSLLNTGQVAALAACHAMDLARRGSPVHLDVSAVEATLATGPVLQVGGVLLDTPTTGGANRYGAPASFYPCIDGLVRISAMEDHQWRGVVTAMESPEWAERFATVEARIDAPEEIDEYVAAWTRTKTKHDTEAELQAHGVPATAVYSPREILTSPQLGHRGAFEALPLDSGRSATVVGLPFVLSEGDKDEPTHQCRRSLQGLRVLEASRVLAVPLAGALLGALGAKVNKLEDLTRLDMYRRLGPYVNGEPGQETSAYFALMNHSKGSVAFDVDADHQRLEDLIKSADVVLENLGPKRATALGLAASVAAKSNPDLLAISSSGFGANGPHADYRAYAYNLQASGALGYLTRNLEGKSAEIDIAWADLISAYALATIIAAWAVGPEGNVGAGVDFSMADLVVAHFNEYIAAASLNPEADDSDRANDLTPFVPHGVYPTADGWVAVAVNGDQEYERFAAVLDYEPLSDVTFDSSEQRRARQTGLDEQIERATRQYRSEELASALRENGIAAERVAGVAELVADVQLATRGFFTAVHHPHWGQRLLIGIPWRVYGQPALPLGTPPLLGETLA